MTRTQEARVKMQQAVSDNGFALRVGTAGERAAAAANLADAEAAFRAAVRAEFVGGAAVRYDTPEGIALQRRIDMRDRAARSLAALAGA